MQKDLKGHNILITGGSKGLGLACTEKLLKHGCNVFVMSRSRGGLAELSNVFSKQLHWLAADLSDRQSVADAFANIASMIDKLDGLVLNAAYGKPLSLNGLSENEIRAHLNINIAGSLYCLQNAVYLLKGGRAIFISSESVAQPYPMLSLYAGTKAAMETIFKGLRREFSGKHEIKLTVLRAGSMKDTAFTESWSEETANAFFEEASESGVGEKSGEPMSVEPVANGIIYILGMPDESTVHEMDIRSATSY